MTGDDVIFAKLRKIGIMMAICLTLIGLNSHDSYAAEKTASSKIKSKKKNSKSKDSKRQSIDAKVDEIPMASSSKMEILANAGLSPSPLLGFGGTLGFIKDTGSGFESAVTYTSGESDTISASVLHIGARYRMGVAKIGYIAAGAGFRMASGKWFVINTEESAEFAAGASLNAVTVDASLGGQIKFGSFLLGADLVGISYPAFKLGVKKTLPSDTGYSENDARSQQAKFDKIAAGMTLTLLKVGAGLMF